MSRPSPTPWRGLTVYLIELGVIEVIPYIELIVLYALGHLDLEGGVLVGTVQGIDVVLEIRVDLLVAVDHPLLIIDDFLQIPDRLLLDRQMKLQLNILELEDVVLYDELQEVPLVLVLDQLRDRLPDFLRVGDVLVELEVHQLALHGVLVGAML